MCRYLLECDVKLIKEENIKFWNIGMLRSTEDTILSREFSSIQTIPANFPSQTIVVSPDL